MTSEYTPIDCELHDIIEIACMLRIETLVRTTEGKELRTFPQDVYIDQNKCEWMSMTDKDNRPRSVRLDQIASLKAAVKNPYFDYVEFQ